MTARTFPYQARLKAHVTIHKLALLWLRNQFL